MIVQYMQFLAKNNNILCAFPYYYDSTIVTLTIINHE